MRITSVENHRACCEARGIRREIRLDLLDCPVVVGDYVLIHAGYALQVMTEADAQATWGLFDQIASTLDHADAENQYAHSFGDASKETS
jgi:hydrogenase expression/formation protein HypC